MQWAFTKERKLGGIPDEAGRGERFKTPDAENAEQAEAVTLDEPKRWASRLSERLRDPGRIWTTEIGIEEAPNAVIFGCRLLCVLKRGMASAPRSIPGFIQEIVADN